MTSRNWQWPALSENNGGEVRAQVVPFQFVLIGPPLAAVSIARFVALMRRPQWRPVRATYHRSTAPQQPELLSPRPRNAR